MDHVDLFSLSHIWPWPQIPSKWRWFLLPASMGMQAIIWIQNVLTTMISNDCTQVFLEIRRSTCQGGDFKSIFYPKQFGIKISPPPKKKKQGNHCWEIWGDPWIQRWKPHPEIHEPQTWRFVPSKKVEMMTTGNQQLFIGKIWLLQLAANSKKLWNCLKTY